MTRLKVESKKCYYCHREKGEYHKKSCCIQEIHDVGESLVEQEEPQLEKESKAVGWICPVCGRGNSPWSMSCPCKVDDWSGRTWTDNTTWTPEIIVTHG